MTRTTCCGRMARETAIGGARRRRVGQPAGQPLDSGRRDGEMARFRGFLNEFMSHQVYMYSSIHESNHGRLPSQRSKQGQQGPGCRFLINSRSLARLWLPIVRLGFLMHLGVLLGKRDNGKISFRPTDTSVMTVRREDFPASPQTILVPHPFELLLCSTANQSDRSF
jgi:hypothetical protein